MPRLGQVPAASWFSPPHRAAIVSSGEESWGHAAGRGILESEYHIRQLPVAGYQSANRAQGYRAIYEADGFVLEPRAPVAPGWRLQLRLARISVGAATLVPMVAPTFRVDDNRLRVAHEGFHIDYRNDETGMRQDFVISSPPQEPVARIIVELAIAGTLDADLRSAHEVAFVDPATAKRVVAYRDLQAQDATGRRLPASMQLEARELRLEVDATGATFPVTIDPLSTTSVWSTNGVVNSWHGRSVAGVGDVNGDGYDDVLVGAPEQNLATGQVFLYNGAADGNLTVGFQAGGNGPGENFGRSVAPAGDFNNDGYADFVVGYPGGGPVGQGMVFVYRGGPVSPAYEIAWAGISGQNSLFGFSVASGDVNCDGFIDIAVGDPYLNAGSGFVGRVHIYFGSAGGFPSAADWTADGDIANLQYGYSLAIADVNGGCDDLVVGAPGGTEGLTSDVDGFVDIFAGVAGGAPASSPSWTLSEPGIANFGNRVAPAGDLNGDGYDEILISWPTYWVNSSTDQTGTVSVYYGSASGPMTGSTSVWQAQGPVGMQSRFGSGISTAGDVNGDGYDDIVVGARAANEAHVYFGSAGGLAEVPNVSSTGPTLAPDWTAQGAAPGDWYGDAVAGAGDVNGDGVDDVLVGAPHESSVGNWNGRVYVYLGIRVGLPAAADWSYPNGAQSTAVLQSLDEALLGLSVDNRGDINDDGYDDIAVGAPWYDTGVVDGGAVFVFHGGAAGPSLNYNSVKTVTDVPYAHFGYSVAFVRQSDDDPFDKLLVGAPDYDNRGRVYLYPGSSSGLVGSPSWVRGVSRQFAKYGHSVASAGDTNEDGYEDVIVGAPSHDCYSCNSLTREGRIYIYYGASSGLNSGLAETRIEGDVSYSRFGHSVGAAGDVNADGVDDVVVGAPYYRNGQFREGRGYVFAGVSGTGVATPAMWTAESNQIMAQFGASVAGAADIFGDGVADIVIGAPRYDPSGQSRGAAFVYSGSEIGLWTAAGSTMLGYWPTGQLGHAVSAADVDGDGLADVVVGAPYYEDGEVNEGATFAYYGSPAGIGPLPDWTMEGGATFARLGFALVGGGDVNGDGVADVVLTAPSAVGQGPGGLQLYLGVAR